ncbi:hypothetical protein BZG36_02608 [Bifiguratus adelaidae]|uniref:Uncharacterized protein n=1 Tax=Bifiguratus adelaidae TaxID=1938954 RepID=A0A261Y305_9FUNG|nr:hypothetical protein BZG36_02608 [Bifiguratus adelaidae]
MANPTDKSKTTSMNLSNTNPPPYSEFKLEKSKQSKRPSLSSLLSSSTSSSASSSAVRLPSYEQSVQPNVKTSKAKVVVRGISKFVSDSSQSYRYMAEYR